MKILQLPDVLHDYLVHVVEKHAQQGIHPEEGVAIARLWEAVTKQVQHIDDKAMAQMAAAGTPTGQSPVTPDPRPVDSGTHYDEMDMADRQTHNK